MSGCAGPGRATARPGKQEQGPARLGEGDEMITETWQIDDEAAVLDRLIDIRTQLVDATEDRDVLRNEGANKALGTMLKLVEYLVGNDTDNPWQDWLNFCHREYSVK